VLAEQVRQPAATPRQRWAKRDAVAVFAALASARLGAVDTLLMGWEAVIDGLLADGGAADPDRARRAGEILDDAERALARIAAFVEHTGGLARADLDELRDHHARSTALLDTLRTQLASVARAVRRYAGLDPDQRDALAEIEAVVGGYGDILGPAGMR
jgi:hypothetical protein